MARQTDASQPATTDTHVVSDAAALSHPELRPRRLVALDVNYARELLLSTARADGSVAGWVATNLRQLADELAFVALSERSLRVASDVEIALIIEQAVVAVAERNQGSGGIQGQATGPGLLAAFRDSILEARMAGVTADALARVARRGTPAFDLARVLRDVERRLAEEKIADPAAVFAIALESFDGEADYVVGGGAVLVEGLSERGLPGELIARLLKRGATVLARPRPMGVATPPHVLVDVGGKFADADAAHRRSGTRLPSLLGCAAAQPSATPADVEFDPALATCDIFAAASAADELREVCRRVVAEGLRWDQVEIVATDPDEYGVALDALAQHLGLGATMLRGIPLARTRLGRAIGRWLGWLENGLPADVIREALEAGELQVAGSQATSTAMARELRLLSIGWGRARYENALAVLKEERAMRFMQPLSDESPEDFAARREARRATSSSLATLLERLLATTPAVPARGSDAQVPATATSLARATLGYLELFVVRAPAEEQTRRRVCARLEQLAALESAEVGFAHAMAALRDLLSQVRAWPVESAERKPWSSSGGLLHLTDLAHAGTTGRPRVFVVGLDAERTSGAMREDPLLDDTLRRSLGASGLPTTAERRDAWEYGVATALAGLRGRVTLSFATSATIDGRDAAPSPLLLGAWRLIRQDQTLSYKDLRDALYPPASPVPAGGRHLDARDVWLDALADGPLLLDGSAAVAAAFPGIAAGLSARVRASGREAGEHQGLVPQAGPALDPTGVPGRQISPSALETQAACALRWFYQYGLAVRPPDDPEYDPDRWLDARDRGSALHELFEAFTRDYAGRQDAIADDAARERILALADATIVAWRARVPPPSEAVFELESAELRRAALAFLQMERELRASGDRGAWSEFELTFGWTDPPGSYELSDGSVLQIKGRADRLDVMPDGTLRVVDYKTGSTRRFGSDPRSGPFNGGRRLQPALYAAAVQSARGREVSRFEYRFPTDKGQNEVLVYGAAALEPARQIVSDLIEEIRSGEFLPTTDPADCSFCDYKAICRVAVRDWGGVESPRARWAADNAESIVAYARLLRRRGGGGGTGEDAE